MTEFTKQEMRDLKKCSKTRLIKNAQAYRLKTWEILRELDETEKKLKSSVDEVHNLRSANTKLNYQVNKLKDAVKSLTECL